ncbi:unnamed protein product, partial [Staurois parvus]
MSVPKAVTPSYTRAYHAALLWESLQHLPCPSLPRCVPCSVPGHLLRLMSASGFHVPVPVMSDVRAPKPAANLKFLKNVIFLKNDYYIVKHSCIKPFHIH